MNIRKEYGEFLLSVDKDSDLENMLPFYRGIHREDSCSENKASMYL